MANKLIKPEETKKLTKWKKLLNVAKLEYDSERSAMDTREAYYNGTRTVQKNPNSNKTPTKEASNVRNIVYELIETQVDSSIPMPKIRAVHPEDKELAKTIENAIINELSSPTYAMINDEQERVTPTQGGDFLHVEWDSSAGTHCVLGALSISERNPKQVIPQPCITDIQKMDYIFVLISQTKDYIKRKYGKDVESASEETPDIRETNDNSANSSEIVTQNLAYYKNSKGGIGLFSWVEDTILLDMEDYQARKLERCTKCGAVKDGDVCECGNKKFEEKDEEFEELVEDIQKSDGESIPAQEFAREEPVLDEAGNPVLDELGNPITNTVYIQTKVPYYKPDRFPLILRKNVTKTKRFLGGSDVDVIIDQQDTIKKLGTKMDEKLLKGGSIVTLPRSLSIETTDRELKVVRVSNPSDVSMINVLNMQPDITKDMTAINYNYEAAKSSLGITDAYQGKYDASAASGTAKQYSINQAAGRLESKRIMKNIAYTQLFELMFKFWLAYADQPIPISSKSTDGEATFSHFNRYDFLKQDAAGEWYWNDEFIFEVDPTSTIMSNREALWQQADLKFQSGAFGPINELESILGYWEFMKDNNYPNAGKQVKKIEERIKKQQLLEQQMQQMQMQQEQLGGATGEMPEL